MLGRLFRIYQRYAMRHLRLERAGPILRGPEGQARARVERIRLDDNRLVVEGWSDAQRVGLTLGRSKVFAEPALTNSVSLEKGFSLRLPFHDQPIGLITEHDGQAQSFDLPQFGTWTLRLARLGLGVRFVADLARSSRDIWAWKIGGDLGRRERVKERLGFVTTSDATELVSTLFDDAPHLDRQSKISIILPVYNAFDLLPETLDRVLKHTDLPFRLLLIEDASPDPSVRPFLQNWVIEAQADGHEIELTENAQNLGFVASVNGAFERAGAYADHVVLLNSDAMVPAGWASRLMAPILADSVVATVTPFSNDGEIFTSPVICHRYPVAPGQVDALDLFATRINPAAGQVDAPTGVGFCMAMNTQFLKDLGGFDTIFGRGYGEETDWCQRAALASGRHVCAANVFVEHRGAASFGTAEKRALLDRNHGIVASRYPGYDIDVQQFIREDPLGSARLAMAVAWAKVVSDAPVPIYLAHALGGGAEMHLQTVIDARSAEGAPSVVLRVGTGHRWRLEVHGPHGVMQGVTNDTALIHALLEPLSGRHVVYSCGVGDRDPVGLPELLVDLAGAEGRLELVFHDFMPLSPSYVLLREDGRYEGLPDVGSGDPAHQSERPGGEVVSLAQWRDAWGKAAARAEQLTVFSEDSARLVAAAFPNAADKIEVTPHKVAKIPTVARPTPDVPVIGVLGNIGFHKGAQVLKDLSRELAKTNAARLVVVGNVDPGFKLARGAVIHGDYARDELPLIIAQYEIDRWLIPSIWPETFSFTTREAIMTGLPVFTFDLGAQADALRASLSQGGHGGLLELPRGEAVDIENVLAQLCAPNLELAP